MTSFLFPQFLPPERSNLTLLPSRQEKKCRALRTLMLLPWVWTMLFVAACTTNRGTWHYQSLHVAGWEYRDSVKFSIDSLATSGTHHLTLALRKSSAQPYPYTTLTLAVRQTWKLGDSLLMDRVDTLECPFENPDGTFRTKGVSLYPYEFPLPTFSLPQRATGYIVVRHLMNRQSLSGFDAIGLGID